jgi:hypothetical protein
VAASDRPTDLPAWALPVLPALGLLALTLIALSLLANPVFLAYDSMQSYSHVWFLSDQIFHHANFPLRISLLDDGNAATFPYGLVPFLIGALIFPIFGNWAVVLMMTFVMLGTIWAATLVRPTLRNPWLILLFIMNPLFIDAVYAFQFVTLWSIFFFFLFVWSFEHDRRLAAGVFLWLALSTHPIIGSVGVASYSAAVFFFDRPRVAQLAILFVPVAIALMPVVWMTLLTPAAGENSLKTAVLTLLIKVLPRRATIMLTPFVLALLKPLVLRYYRVTFAFFTASLGLGLMLATGPIAIGDGSYYGVTHRSSDIYASFFASPQFHPGATYRVMEPNDREDGMYFFMQHGAVLGNEFFTESIFRNDWTVGQYECFLSYKEVNYVVIEQAYVNSDHTNEKNLLDSFVTSGLAEITYADPADRFTVYDVQASNAQTPRPTSFDSCGFQ